MKTERRHDLETNALAKELAVWTESLKPHANKILALCGILVALYIVGNLWSSHQRKQNREFWDVYETALTVSDPDYRQIQQIALSDEYSSTEGKEWALLAWADRQVLIAATEYFSSREQAFKRLDSVIGVYSQLSTGAASETLRDRAKFGLARTDEMRGKIDEAKQNYASVRGVLQPLAAARLKALENPTSEQAVEWLATAKLPKRVPPTGGGVPGLRPDFGAELPNADGGDQAFDPTSSIADLLENLEENEKQEAAEEARYSEDEPPVAEENAANADSSETASESDNTQNETGSSDSDAAETSPANESPAEEKASSESSEADSAKSE